MSHVEEVDGFVEKAERLLKQPPIRTKDYLQLCKDGIELSKKYPLIRSDIGYYLVSAGSALRLSSITELAPNLEYPSSGKDWQDMERLVEETMKELSEDF